MPFCSLVTTALQAADALDALRGRDDCGLVIDGVSLQTCMDHCRDEFMAIVVRLPTVVCCRCSPTQKVNDMPNYPLGSVV